MKKTQRIMIVILLVSAIFPFVATDHLLSAERAGKPIPVRIAVVSRSTLDLPFWVALERGFFREEGLDAEIILFKASMTVQAMMVAVSISAQRREPRSAQRSMAQTLESYTP